MNAPLKILYFVILKTGTFFMSLLLVQAAFFGCLAMSTLRMKYLWTPYMCILASVGLADYNFWKTLISKFSNRESIVRFLFFFSSMNVTFINLFFYILLTIHTVTAYSLCDEVKSILWINFWHLSCKWSFWW